MLDTPYHSGSHLYENIRGTSLVSKYDTCQVPVSKRPARPDTPLSKALYAPPVCHVPPLARSSKIDRKEGQKYGVWNDDEIIRPRSFLVFPAGV